jgi:hypothetical protein
VRRVVQAEPSPWHHDPVKTPPKSKKAAARNRKAAARTLKPSTRKAQKAAPSKKAASGRPAPSKKAASGRPAPSKKPASGRPAPSKKPSPGKKPGPSKKPAPTTTVARRADFGAPIDGFFAKQAPNLRPILEALRKIVEEGAPDATASIKWGMPNYSIGRAMVCAMAGFKSHVNLIVAGPPEIFADPDGLLEGGGKTGRHLKLRTIEELPREAARDWVRVAAQFARKKSSVHGS